jgi:hypothetical protein
VSVKIALIPLDERPVNTRYPKMIGEIAGIEVVLPPDEIRGLIREPADVGEVAEWLRSVSRSGIVGAAVSCDYLGYGNLINARISDDSAARVISRLGVLEETASEVPVHAFSLITRVSNADDDVEEPRYWREWGTRYYAYSKLKHREDKDDLDESDRAALADLARALPDGDRADWLRRRLRNHTVNLALMDMAARGRIESLLLTSDDTALYGFPTRERDWLKSWIDLIGENAAARVRMHPGADEVGSALVARLANTSLKHKPRVWAHYAIWDDKELIAPYEDRPIRQTVLGQIEACGCEPALTINECDFVLGVVTPSPRRTDYRPQYADTDRADRAEAYAAFLQRLGKWRHLGLPVALADVAYPNGSDPLMTEMLLAADCPLRAGDLAAYGAWNTAGNTLGVVVAQASSALKRDGDPVRSAAQLRFLAHRFVEDYGYQQRVRREARAFAMSRWGREEPRSDSPDEQAEIAAYIEARLSAILSDLASVGVGNGLRIAPGSTRLPWRRTFEVDFELTQSSASS